MSNMYPDEDPKPVQMQIVMPRASSVIWWGIKMFFGGILALLAIILAVNIIMAIIIWVTGLH